MQWFRFHAATVNKEKAQKLSGDTFKAWVNMLCVACACDEDGYLPSEEALAFALRLPLRKTQLYTQLLVDADLIDKDGTRYRMHDWKRWQYGDDSSTQRTREYRKRITKQAANVTDSVTKLVTAVTANVTDVVTECDASRERKRNDFCSVSVSESVSEEKKDDDFSIRFEAYYQRHPGSKSRHGACLEQYLRIVGDAVNPLQTADSLDRDHREWMKYWAATKQIPLGLFNFLRDGDCFRKPPALTPDQEEELRWA